MIYDVEKSFQEHIKAFERLKSLFWILIDPFRS